MIYRLDGSKFTKTGSLRWPGYVLQSLEDSQFIVRLEGGTKPTHVWTGSTNFTPSGFLGQTNVAHLVTDGATGRAVTPVAEAG